MSSFHKSKPGAGSQPGSLSIPEDSPPPRIRVMRYHAEGVEEFEDVEVARLSELEREGTTTWVDVQGLGDEGVLRQLGEHFALHPLVLENAVNIPQRAKSEMFDDQHVIVARVPLGVDEDEANTPPQVCIVVGGSWLVTFRERHLRLFDGVRDRLRTGGGGRIRKHGPDYLAYALLDAVIDHYYPVVEKLAEELEILEDEIASEPHPDALGHVHRIRRALVVIRRVGRPQVDALRDMVHHDGTCFSDTTRTFLRSTHDHACQIMELVDGLRESALGLADLYVSQVSFHTNEIMKVLTLMASIFIPLTFVAGIYGMNFENMPELRNERAYFIVLAVMIAIAVTMLVWFRRRGWLGRGKPPGRKGPPR